MAVTEIEVKGIDAMTVEKLNNLPVAKGIDACDGRRQKDLCSMWWEGQPVRSLRVPRHGQMPRTL